MNNDKPIYLRRLRTKDGIIGPIEQVFEPRPTEHRATRCLPRATIIELPDYEMGLQQSRRYRIKEQVECLLFEMEEE